MAPRPRPQAGLLAALAATALAGCPGPGPGPAAPDPCRPAGSCDPARQRCDDPAVLAGSCVGPAGALLRFAGGVELEVPPGALPERTFLSLSAVAPAAVDAAVRARSTAQRTRTLAAFEVGPSGLSFPAPLTLRFPAPRLAPGELLLHMTVDPVTGRARVEQGSLRVDGAASVVELHLSHLSTQAAVAFSHRSDVCLDPATWTEAECKDPVQAPCCSWADRFRPEGCRPGDPAWPATCCKEVEAVIVSAGQELATSACQILSQALEVTFPACADPVTDARPYVMKDALSGTTPECGALTWTATVEAPATARLCTPVPVSVSLTGKSEDGTVAVGPSKVSATWEVTPAGAAELSLPKPTGPGADLAYQLTGKVDGLAALIATVTVSEGKTVSAAAEIDLTCRTCGPITFTSEGAPISTGTVISGFDLPVAAVLAGADGKPADPTDFSWSVVNPTTIGLVSEFVNRTASVTARGLELGPAWVTATWDDGCERLTGSLPVTVVGIGVTPATAVLRPGEVTFLQATNTIPGYSCEVRWLGVSPDVVLLPEGTDGVWVTAGPNLGTSHVTAACGEYQGYATIEIVAPEPPGPPTSLVLTSDTLVAVAGEPLDVTARGYDAAGRLVPDLPCTLVWSTAGTSQATLALTGPATARVTPAAIGRLSVQVSCGGLFGALSRLVKGYPATIRIQPWTAYKQVRVGERLQLGAVYLSATGATIQPADLACTPSWWSGAPGVATVDGAGSVLGLSRGVAPIFHGCGPAQDRAEVTVVSEILFQGDFTQAGSGVNGCPAEGESCGYTWPQCSYPPGDFLYAFGGTYHVTLQLTAAGSGWPVRVTGTGTTSSSFSICAARQEQTAPLDVEVGLYGEVCYDWGCQFGPLLWDSDWSRVRRIQFTVLTVGGNLIFHGPVDPASGTVTLQTLVPSCLCACDAQCQAELTLSGG